MSHRCCHFVWRNLLIVGFRSMYGTERTSGLRPKADLAAESTLSFPLTTMWLGIQHKIIFLWLDIESSLLSSLTINEFSSFLFFSDVKTDSESENLINLLCFSLEMILGQGQWQILLKWRWRFSLERLSCVCCFIVILGAIRKYILMVRMV